MEAYLHQLSSIWQQEDAYGISNLLSLRKMENFAETDDRIEKMTKRSFQGISDTAPMTFLNLLKARKYLYSHDYSIAYEYQQTAFIKFLDEFRASTSAWLVPLLETLVYDLRMLALQVDRIQNTSTTLREAEQQLKKSFGKSSMEKSCPEKKLASLYIANQLFKIYFKLKTIVLCRNIIRAVEGPAFPDFEKFPKSEKVTYKFYAGRVALFADDYNTADACLSYALKHCHVNAKKNMRLILQFLIPLKMFLGFMPRMELLQTYGFQEYLSLRQAVMTGNIKLYEKVYEEYMDQFVEIGMLLLIERLKYVLYRNLMKRTCSITDSHLIPMQNFQMALQIMSDEEPELVDVECILANMIYTGYMKGYLSHAKATAVLSKKTPFPAICDVVR